MAKLNQKNLALAADERKFNLILVGHDDTTEGVASYLKKSGLGCAAVKTPIGKMEFGEPLTTLLTNGYTGSIPAVLLLDKDGKLVSRDQREILLKLNKLSRGKSKRVKEREARAAAKKAAAEAAGKE
ncbi:MAG: TlpA family protein disulfide reductase [Verrucomicrobiales bacterium]